MSQSVHISSRCMSAGDHQAVSDAFSASSNTEASNHNKSLVRDSRRKTARAPQLGR